MSIALFRPTEVMTRTGPARELLSPTIRGDEWHEHPILLQLPGEEVGREKRSRSLLVDRISLTHDETGDSVEVRFVDGTVEPVRFDVDDIVTVHHVTIVGL